MLPHQAPRGDLFRELAEQDQAVATRANPNTETPQQGRQDVYRRLANSWSFTGKKKPRGPVDRLRRLVGSNRCAEFESWLKHLPGVKGASLVVRYTSLLSHISEEIDDVAADFRYTDSRCALGTKDPTQEARDTLTRARSDVAELPHLFRDMELLYCCLHYTKRHIVCPPPPPTPQELEASREKARKREREPRVEESRKYLRELSNKKKLRDDDIRRGFGWITLEGTLMMLDDDIRGYANVKPLWSSVPSTEQLAGDYQISEGAATRVLAAYSHQKSDADAVVHSPPLVDD